MTEKYHDRDWLEWEVPKVLLKELEDIVREKIKKFKETCGCMNCQEDRLEEERRKVR